MFDGSSEKFFGISTPSDTFSAPRPISWKNRSKAQEPITLLSRAIGIRISMLDPRRVGYQRFSPFCNVGQKEQMFVFQFQQAATWSRSRRPRGHVNKLRARRLRLVARESEQRIGWSVWFVRPVASENANMDAVDEVKVLPCTRFCFNELAFHLSSWPLQFITICPFNGIKLCIIFLSIWTVSNERKKKLKTKKKCRSHP